jgi:hypothetical protein
MKNYFRDISAIIPSFYENTSPFTPNILEVSKFHGEIEQRFDEMVNNKSLKLLN